MTNPRYKFLNNLNKIELDTNRMLIDVGGNNIMTIDSNNVGIGTTSSGDKLDVNGSLNIATGNDYNINSVSVLNATTLASSVINSSLTNVGTLSSLNMSGQIDMNNNNIIDVDEIQFQDNVTSYIISRGDSTNWHGLSLSNQNSVGTQDALLKIRKDNTVLMKTNTTTRMDIDNSRTEIMNNDLIVDTNTLYVDSSNNEVGIGTLTPGSKLDVSGDINTTSNYKINGTEVLNSTTLASSVVNSSLTSVGTLTDLTVTNGITGNEVFPTKCSTIGSLGYILTDEFTSTDILNENYATKVSLETNNSDLTFNHYKIIFNAVLPHSNTNNPEILYRFFEGSDVSAYSGSQYFNLVGSGDAGSSIKSSYNQDKGIFITGPGGSSSSTSYYSGELNLFAGTIHPHITGRYSAVHSGASTRSNRIMSGGTDDGKTFTSITGIAFDANNVDSGTGVFNCRIYRML